MSSGTQKASRRVILSALFARILHKSSTALRNVGPGSGLRERGQILSRGRGQTLNPTLACTIARNDPDGRASFSGKVDPASPAHRLETRTSTRPSFARYEFYAICGLAAAHFSSALAEEAYDYDADIDPILEQYCVKCHGPKKQKSKFRLDSYERLMRGGSSEEAPIIPYQPMQSPMLEYLLLPKSDEYAMPPEDEETPSPEEILKIAHWIYHGAKSKSSERNALPLEELLDENQRAAISNLRSRGAIIHKRGEKAAGIIVDLQQVPDPLRDQVLVGLASLASHLRELRLPGHAVSNSALNRMGELDHLTHLDLSNGDFEDDIVTALNHFQSLQYLNLFGTRLSDAGLENLRVPRAGRLYLGNTGVTTEAIARFKKEHPDVEIYGSVDLESVLQITEEAKQNSRLKDLNAE